MSLLIWLSLDSLFKTYIFRVREKTDSISSCLSTALPLPQPRLTAFWLMLCAIGLSQLPWKIPTLPPPHRSRCGNTTAEKEFSLFPNIWIFWGGGIKLAMCTREKTGECEKTSVFLISFSHPFACAVQLSFAAGRWHCYTGKRFPLPARPKSMVCFPCAVLRSFPALGQVTGWEMWHFLNCAQSRQSHSHVGCSRAILTGVWKIRGVWLSYFIN